MIGRDVSDEIQIGFSRVNNQITGRFFSFDTQGNLQGVDATGALYMALNPSEVIASGTGQIVEPVLRRQLRERGIRDPDVILNRLVRENDGGATIEQIIGGLRADGL